MAAIYLTGITITMLNITGIIFVVIMMIMNPSQSKLKKANLKKSTTVQSSIEKVMESASVSAPEVSMKTDSAPPAKSATAAAAAVAAAAVTETADKSKNIADFENIDDILDDLDLSDFDDLDLDDFS